MEQKLEKIRNDLLQTSKELYLLAKQQDILEESYGVKTSELTELLYEAVGDLAGAIYKLLILGKGE